MEKEATTTQEAQEAAKGITFFEAVKVLLADDMAKGGFEIVRIKENIKNAWGQWGQFCSTWEDESGLHLYTILVYKNQWGNGFDIVYKDEITREMHYKYINLMELNI